MTQPISVEQARRFAAIFAGRISSYGTLAMVDGLKQARTVNKPLPDDAYARHLEGDGPTLGIVPIREDDTCFFGAIDFDDDAAEHHQLEAQIAALRLPLVVCRSKSGAAHLYLFLREATPATEVVAALKQFRKQLGIEKSPADGKPVEIFPKQVKALGQAGNWINIPYYGAADTNRYAVAGGRVLTLDEFFEHAVARSVTLVALKRTLGDGAGPFDDGPPCLQSLHKMGFPEGGRNAGLLNVGIYLKLKYPDDWSERLETYNDGIDRPIESDELLGVQKNLGRTEYKYMCGQHPLEAVCQKRPCSKQPYGIGFYHKADRLAALPDMTSLVKIKTDPPRYRLTVSGVEIPLSAEELLSPIQFKRVLFERLSRTMPIPRPGEWDTIIQELCDHQTEETAPVEAGERGLLVMFMNDFLILRSKAQSAEDVLRGWPYHDPAKGRVYFRATDFMAFLQRRRFTRFAMNELFTALTELAGLTFETLSIKGASVKLWSVPEPTDDQTEQFSYPVGPDTLAY